MSTAPCAPYPASGERLRTDLSCTLFLCEPEDYDGGELEVVDTYGTHEVKLPAGDLILYPSSSLHRVQPVTRGARICSFFWMQSMVRDDAPAAHAVRARPGHPQAARPARARREETVALTATITTCCACGARYDSVGTIVIANASNSYL